MINIRNVDLNLLVAFDALYDTRNVTRASERLALTQPTVSGMLARLRHLFGDPLFVRTQHGVLPTPRAQELATPVKDLLTAVEALVKPDVFDPASAQMTVSISANDYMQDALIVPFIERLRRQAPGIRLTVMPAYTTGLAERLARGAIDLALSVPEFAGTDLPHSFLYTERYVCIARENHPFKERKMSLDAFCRFDHVVVSPAGGSLTGPADRALAELGERRRVSISLPSFHVMLETVRAGDFLALVPERLLRGRMSGLKLIQPPPLAPDFDVIACWHGRVEADPAHRWIRDLVCGVANGVSNGARG